MQARNFGPTRRAVPVVGQGTWRIDGAERAEAVRALRAGIDAGMRHIDTAEMYGGAEAVVAEAVAGRRDAGFLVSKVVPGNATRSGVARVCEASLRRLGTDRLDGYLLHWPGGATPGSGAAALAAGAAADLAYPAKVSLDRDWLLVDGRREPLRPGMRVSAEVRTGERRVLEYLLSPVVQAVQEAGRER